MFCKFYFSDNCKKCSAKRELWIKMTSVIIAGIDNKLISSVILTVSCMWELWKPYISIQLDMYIHAHPCLLYWFNIQVGCRCWNFKALWLPGFTYNGRQISGCFICYWEKPMRHWDMPLCKCKYMHNKLYRYTIVL